MISSAVDVGGNPRRGLRGERSGEKGRRIIGGEEVTSTYLPWAANILPQKFVQKMLGFLPLSSTTAKVPLPWRVH